MKVPVVVVSKTPPGGRCELYSRIMFEIVKAHRNVYYTLIPADIYEEEVSPPVVLVGGEPIYPEDGVMLTPSEILTALKDKGAEPREDISSLEEILWEMYEDFLSDL